MPRLVAMKYNPLTLQHLVKKAGDPDSEAKLMPPALISTDGSFQRLAGMCHEAPGQWVFADGREQRSGPRHTAVIQ